MFTTAQIQQLQDILIEASHEIMKVYAQHDLGVEYKDDASPLTLADKASHEVLIRWLRTYFPEIPALSEEDESQSYEERKDWDLFRSVDPLDWTKEFINRNGEFCVCLWLVKKDRPVFGMIAAPVQERLYRWWENLWSRKKTFGWEAVSLTWVSHDSLSKKKIRATWSRSHWWQQDQDFFDALQKEGYDISIVPAWSALKFCRLAEWDADIYARFKPTMERDTAAGHAIVEQVGYVLKKVNESPNESWPLWTFLYNKEQLVNPWFIVFPKELPIDSLLR